MIGILAAMDTEVMAIKNIMNVKREEVYQGINFIYGTINDKKVVLCKCGVGKCLASMSATLLCTKEKLESLINVGVAGGLKENQNVLDIVISNEVIQADYDTSPIDGDQGIGLSFKADSSLVKLCGEAAEKLDINYHIGTISSQDIFMARKEDYDKLMKRFPSSACAEMEGGAVGQVATFFKVPFLVVRSLSDVVGHEDNPMEFTAYAQIASKQAASIILAML